MKQLIEKVLYRTGYPHLEPTEENLISIYMEFVDHGIFKNLDEAQEMFNDGDLTIKMICVNLLSIR